MKDQTLENFLLKNGIRKRSSELSKKEMHQIDDSYIWSFPTMKAQVKVEHPCRCDWLFESEDKSKQAG